MAEKRLEMVFKNAGGNRTTISVLEPKDSLTGAEVNNVMNNILQKNVFITSGGELVEKVEARIISRETTVLNLG